MNMYSLLLVIQLIGTMTVSNSNHIHSVWDYSIFNISEHQEQPLRPQDVTGAVVHEPVLLDEYNHQSGTIVNADGSELGYSSNTLTVNGYDFSFKDESGNTGQGEDFERLNNLLDQNLAVRVGNDRIQTFFGHYYDLTGTGVFNPLADQHLLHEGSEVIVTDGQGKSKGYLITQTIEFLHEDQGLQFYGEDYMPTLAYHGNEHEMIYIQYCRWDIQLGLLITNIGYRIW